MSFVPPMLFLFRLLLESQPVSGLVMGGLLPRPLR